MYYIIFDLEWSNGYSYKRNGFMNEIIEIGAVKLNENLDIIEDFKQLVKLTETKKLSSRCKNLTNISNELLKSEGISFSDALKDFARWSKGDNNIFLTWSNSDLYVLANNCLTALGSPNVQFIKKYCDAQKYCMSYIKTENNNQISLANASEILGVEVDVSKLHRALTDCYVTAECLKKVFDKEKFKCYVHDCEQTYFERLIYKPYLIEQPVSSLFNVYEQKMLCPVCNSEMKALKKFECVNKSFRCPTKCPDCKKTFWTTIRAKKTYDDVEVYVKSVLMNKKRAKRLDK